MTAPAEPLRATSLRIGTWNLAGRPGARQRAFLDRLDCDLLLLTEVPERLDLSPWAVAVSEGSIRDGVRYAAVAAPALAPAPSPHPASAVADVLGLRVCASVLPWRTCGAKAPWQGANQTERTASACGAIAGRVLDLWGGDWNHAMEQSDWAGSRGGRAAIEGALLALGLRVVTGTLPAAGGRQRSIDHIAVPLASVIESAERVVAADERGRLSDHDAYVVMVGPAGLRPAASRTCGAGDHRWRPVVYGFPTPATFDAAERGEVLLGGCVVWGESPRERCVDCGAEHFRSAMR